MKHTPRFLAGFLAICVAVLIAEPTRGEIILERLSKEKAKEKYGITMHSRKNGDTGIKVWLEFEQERLAQKFTSVKLRMVDAAGKHLLSAKLQPNPVHHRQSKDITTVAFSANADQLERCSFLVVCYGSNEGDVGYYLHLKDFLDLKNPATEK